MNGAALRACLFAIVLLTIGSGAAQAGLQIRNAKVTLENSQYLLNANLDLQLPAAAEAALNSGVPLTIRTDITVYRQRRYAWDATVVDLIQRHVIEYHALSGKYVLVNENTGIRTSYQQLDELIYALSSLRRFPIISRDLLGSTEGLYAELEIGLEIERLPVPMRPFAYVDSEWQLNDTSTLTWPASAP